MWGGIPNYNCVLRFKSHQITSSHSTQIIVSELHTLILISSLQHQYQSELKTIIYPLDILLMAKGSTEIAAGGTANWSALHLRTQPAAKFKPARWCINLSNSDVCAGFPGRNFLYWVTFYSPLMGLLCVDMHLRRRVSSSLKAHDWQETCFYSSSVSLDEVCAISSEVAYWCWHWLKQHQSPSHWLWILHMSAYMRDVLNNNRGLNVCSQSKMENAALPAMSSFGIIIFHLQLIETLETF